MKPGQSQLSRFPLVTNLPVDKYRNSSLMWCEVLGARRGVGCWYPRITELSPPFFPQKETVIIVIIVPDYG